MFRYRLSEAAQGDVLDILAWTDEQFGEAVRLRYESLIVAALRDLARQPDIPGSLARPELGAGARSWHRRAERLRLAGDIGRRSVRVIKKNRVTMRRNRGDIGTR